MRLFVLPLLTLALALPVLSSDGVIEINRVKALAGGINGSLVDDPPGFPVNITQTGSYRLTGGLRVNGTAAAITIDAAASYATLDLNGFAIKGDARAPSGVGVDASAASYVTVKNGSVVTFSTGLNMGPDSRIDGSSVANA